MSAALIAVLEAAISATEAQYPNVKTPAPVMIERASRRPLHRYVATVGIAGDVRQQTCLGVSSTDVALYLARCAVEAQPDATGALTISVKPE